MENEKNTSGVENNNLSDLKQMFADYQKKSQPTKRKSREDLLAKYFVPRKTRETFRILPPKPGKKRIEEAFFHAVPTTIAGGKTKHGTIIYCPAHNDPKVKKLDGNGNPILDQNGNPVMIPAPCPLCAKAKKILSTQDPSLKGVKKENMNEAQKLVFEKNKKIFMDANKWEAKKFYIIRGIDKGVEKDGVKFWRFKHNFKNQGTLDKLLPILDQYVSKFGADYSDTVEGTDLTILMVDSEFNGRTYKAISAIMYDGKSKLHEDPIVVKQWLDDDISWRDVFLPKKAPGIEPYEFLEMVANGTNPYWDDTDSNNKRWVFPGRPDLELAANTRTRNLDADDEQEFEQASDLDEDGARITIGNITESKVGTYKDDVVDLTASAVGASTDEEADENLDAEDVLDGGEESYDDLPF
jgi:glutaredoxin